MLANVINKNEIVVKFLAIFLFPMFLFGADTIPADRRATWTKGTHSGVYGGIPTSRTQWTNFVTAGADPTGVADCTALLINLINNCAPNKYIYAPEGRYKLLTALIPNGLSNNWTIKGAGTNTVFVPTQGFINYDVQTYGGLFNIHGGVAKGASTFSTEEDCSEAVGRNAIFSTQNRGRTNVNIIAVDFSDRLIQQVVEIVSVTDGTNVTIRPPLLWDHPEELNPYFLYNTSTQVEGIGFEDFMIDASDAESANCISLFGLRNSWAMRLRIIDPNGFAFNLTGNLFLEIRDSYFFSTREGANTAVILMGGDTGDLIENNFSYGGSPFVECNSSSGNVIAYNFATNAVSNDFHVGNPYDNHSPHSMMNLWEGNYGTMYQSDSYFGSSSHNTLFQNRFTGYDPIKPGLPRCIDLGRWSTYWNLVNNVLGDDLSDGLIYTTIEQYYSGTQPVIMRFGFPYPGNSSYGYVGFTAQTPSTDWRFPGTNRLAHTMTVDVFTPTHILSGDFSSVEYLDQIGFQSAADTNYYYNFQSTYPRLSSTSFWIIASITLIEMPVNADPIDITSVWGETIQEERRFWTNNVTGHESDHVLIGANRPASFANLTNQLATYPAFGAVVRIGDSATNFNYHSSKEMTLSIVSDCLETSSETTKSGSTTNLILNQLVVTTNGAGVYRIGPDAFPQLTLDDTNTHHIQGNYDFVNNARTGTADPTFSYYLPEGTPAWATNVDGNTLEFPFVDPETGTRTVFAAEALAYGIGGEGVGDTRPGVIQIRIGPGVRANFRK
jgi:hypothetical protein